jgi:hypothetical protein
MGHTFECIVENGLVRLPVGLDVPNHTKVLVTVPETESEPVARVFSPRLVRPEESRDFDKLVIEDAADAGV